MNKTLARFMSSWLVLAAMGLAQAADWPQFRGATGDGVSHDQNLPLTWSEERGLLWKTKLIGRANSSPAVTSKRIDLTTKMDDESLWVLSYDRATGNLIRTVQVGSGSLVAKGAKNLWAHRHNAATPSPVADEQHVWAYFGTGLLVCLDARTGAVVWQRDLVDDYGQYDITFGMGSSPRLWGELLIINCMTKGPSYVLALDKASGRTVWKVDRKLPADDDGPDAYSTPTIAVTDKGAQLLVAGSDHVDAYDLKTGKQIWISGGLKIDSPYGRVIAAPQISDGIVVATSGNPGGAGLGHMIALKAGGLGDVTNSHGSWKFPKRSPDSSSPVIFDGRVFLTTDAGIATCLDLKTGREIWAERLGKGPFQASLVAGDGKVYFLSIDGLCVVTNTKGKVLARNKLPGTFYATPAISDGTIYLRSYETLYAIRGK